MAQVLAAEHAHNLSEQVLEGEEAGQCDADEDRGEEREEEVEREPGRQAEAVVGHELPDRPRDEIAARQRLCEPEAEQSTFDLRS
jgi:hypothetical protein